MHLLNRLEHVGLDKKNNIANQESFPTRFLGLLDTKADLFRRFICRPCCKDSNKVDARKTRPRFFAASKRRAFIAAPLIGTILFLTAVLFTVNLNKIESAQSARIVNDAYHNRIVSLIEIYRTDLNSVFRESVRRNIQSFILDPGWNNLDLQNKGDDRTFDSAKYLNKKQIRLQRCESIKKLSKQVVCAISSDNQGSATNTGSFGYGIPAWIEVAGREFSFEGIRFKPANPEQMKLLNPPHDLPDPDAKRQAFDAYTRACQNLVQENLFDCEYFANKESAGPEPPNHPYGPFQCIEQDASGNKRVLKGCEEGNFYVRVDPRGVSSTTPSGDKALFAALPRIEGDDGFGNQVRSAAIGDEPFFLPINLRVFFYDDFALEFYNNFAFGPDLSNPGLVDGICVGEKGCKEKGFRTHEGSGFPNTDDGRRKAESLAAKKASNSYNAAKQALKNRRQLLQLAERDPKSGKFYINFYLLFGNTNDNQCLDSATKVPASSCKDVIGTMINPTSIQTIDALKPRAFLYPENPPNKWGAAYDEQVSLQFFVFDDRPEFKVSGTEPNHPSYGMRFVYQS